MDSPSGVPFNVSPFVLPYDCFLTNITVSTSLPGTCSVFVRSNGVDVIGASVTLTNSASIAENFAIQLTGNQPIEIYLQTISPVSHPNVNLIFQKNI